MATAPMKYLNNIDSYLTPSTGRGQTKITDFSQDPIQGMPGTSNPYMKTVDPDDKFKIGYNRVLRDLNDNNKKIRPWRIKRYLKKNNKKIKSDSTGAILKFEHYRTAFREMGVPVEDEFEETLKPYKNESNEYIFELYHGTPSKFDKFSLKNFGSHDNGWLGRGVYFTNDYSYAKSYGNVILSKIKVKSPYVLKDFKYSITPNKLSNELNADNAKDITEKLIKMGYDSVLLTYEDLELESDMFIELCVFDIKNIEIKKK